jgi:hypothetical protein
MPESDSTAFFFEFDETAIVSPGFQRLPITIIQSRWLAGGWASKAKEEASMLNVQLLGTPSFRILDRPAGGELGKAGACSEAFSSLSQINRFAATICRICSGATCRLNAGAPPSTPQFGACASY